MTRSVRRLFLLTLLALSALILSACAKPYGNGKTAYELAVENGFVGNEQEWLESLKTPTAPTVTDISVSGGRVHITYSDGTAATLDDIPLESDSALSFFLLPDDTYAVSCAERQIFGAVIVPSSFRGKPVTRLLEGAFENCRYLFSLTLPDSITHIGENALRGCDNLLSLTVPFLGATRADAATAHFGYFFGAKSDRTQASVVPAALTSVTLTDTAELAARAFAGCAALQHLSLPDTLTAIGLGALEGCDGLLSLQLPFVGAAPSGNAYTHFTYLFGAEAHAQDILFPSGLAEVRLTAAKEIAPCAFYNCHTIERLYLPDTLLKINAFAFANCRMQEIHLPTDGWQSDSLLSQSLGDSAEQNATLLITCYEATWSRTPQ